MEDLKNTSNYKKQTIMIKKECLDKEEQTFLHEFLRCISTHKKNNSNICWSFNIRSNSVFEI